MTYQNAYLCAACKHDYFLHLAQGTLQERHTPPHYFARRAMAKIVDVNLIVLFQFAVTTTLIPLASDADAVWLMATATGLTLFAFLAVSTITTVRNGGTPGKQLFHLQVVYRDGTPLSRGGAFTRSVSELASLACIGLGYFITDREGTRRTLHDRLSGTEVIARKGDWPWT